jgi:uncharacterized protein with NRDE domain
MRALRPSIRRSRRWRDLRRHLPAADGVVRPSPDHTVCLILLALNVMPQRPWLLLGNRDEFHARPSAPAQAWTDAPDVIGGRDLEAGGSWLAINRNGRFAAITNVRSGQPRRGIRSRGELVATFASGAATPVSCAAETASHRDEFGPFNFVIGDREAAACASSLRGEAWSLGPGVHVFSNGPPDAAWPKALRLREGFLALSHERESGDGAMLDLLADVAQPSDDELPQTGVNVELERMLAPIFIRGEQYGTRASTLAYARSDGRVVLRERRFGPGGIAAGETRIET